MELPFTNKLTIYNQREHSHEHYEIAVTVSGNGSTYINGCEFPIKQGNIIIFPPGTRHSHKSQTGFSNIFVRKIKPPFTIENAVSYLDNTDMLVNLANMIYINYMQKEFNYEAINQKLLETLFEYIKRLRGKSSRYEFVQKFKDIITENFSNPSFEIPTEAEKLGISFDYMRHCFKEETGMTPLEYLTQIRIEQAKNHLMNSFIYSISEIAGICGFSDQYYFSKVFKKTTGVSPREFKKKSRTDLI